MVKVLFVCHGNICRSPMAEFLFKDWVKKLGLESGFEIASAATSMEELGNPVYPGTRRILARLGIDTDGKFARRMTAADYAHYDYLIAMDTYNVRNMARFVGNDPDGKVSLLLDFAGRTGEGIADPWYTDDFQQTYDDIRAGLSGFLRHLIRRGELSDGEAKRPGLITEDEIAGLIGEFCREGAER